MQTHFTPKSIFSICFCTVDFYLPDLVQSSLILNLGSRALRDEQVFVALSLLAASGLS
jgi:hypothetical protein